MVFNIFTCWLNSLRTPSMIYFGGKCGICKRSLIHGSLEIEEAVGLRRGLVIFWGNKTNYSELTRYAKHLKSRATMTGGACFNARKGSSCSAPCPCHENSKSLGLMVCMFKSDFLQIRDQEPAI